MKVKFCFSIIWLIILACDTNSCFIEEKIKNLSAVDIIVLPCDPAEIMSSPWMGDTIRIASTKGYTYDWGRSGADGLRKELTMFSQYDSIYVVFDNADAVTHYKDSLKGNYERSLFNLEAYVKDGCKFTYTFTQQDYEAAKAGM